MRYRITLDTIEAGQSQRVMDTGDLLGVITGRLTSYTMIMNPDNPLTSTITIDRIGDGE